MLNDSHNDRPAKTSPIEPEVLPAEPEHKQLPGRPVRAAVQRASRQIAAELTRWEPERLAPPGIDHDLPRLSPVQRGAEVLRYQFLRLEYVLSPAGVMREWVKFMVRAAVFLLLPLSFAATFAVFVLAQAAAGAVHAARAVSAILKTVVAGAVIAVIVKAAVTLFKGGSSRR